MDKQERATLGPLIRAAREGLAWSQEELAVKAGTTRRTIGSIERGDTTGQTKKIEAVLDALGLVEGLVTEADVKTFVQTLTPLLQRLTVDERAQVMPAIVRLVADALARHGTPDAPDTNVHQFPVQSDRMPTMDELAETPSAAQPDARNDVEGTEEPEGP